MLENIKYEDGTTARIEYYPSKDRNKGIKFAVYYNRYHQTHKDNDEPAVVGIYDNGMKQYQGWYENGKKHREGFKPAFIWYDKNGNETIREYWINDIILSEDDVIRLKRKIIIGKYEIY